YDAAATGARVVGAFRAIPPERAVEAERPFVAQRCDCLEPRNTGRPAVALERFVEKTAYAPPSVFGVDANQVHVSDFAAALRILGDKAQKETHDGAIVLDNPGEIAELVEKDRVRKSACGPPPPAVDDLHDEVVVGFLQGPRFHEFVRHG